MKSRWMLTGLVLAALALAAPAQEAAPADPTAALAQRLDQLSQKLSEQLQALDRAVKEIQERLGDSFGRPTAFNSVERRLEDIEKRLDRLERDLDDLGDQLRRLDRGR
ncbi:MAG: hypothetical protein KA248_07210 [Kiritimatiellae bacterium]|nr:hypothetical protein [Kiritimatiellia bacterium]